MNHKIDFLQRAQSCIFSYFTYDYEDQCYSFSLLKLNLKKTELKHKKCQFGYLQYDENCWRQYLYMIKQTFKTSQKFSYLYRMFDQSKDWINYAYCEKYYFSDTNYSPFQLKNEIQEFYVFDGRDLNLCEECQNPGNFYKDYISTNAYFKNFCQQNNRKEQLEYCYIDIFLDCQKYKIQISGPVCIKYSSELILESNNSIHFFYLQYSILSVKLHFIELFTIPVKQVLFKIEFIVLIIIGQIHPKVLCQFNLKLQMIVTNNLWLDVHNGKGLVLTLLLEIMFIKIHHFNFVSYLILILQAKRFIHYLQQMISIQLLQQHIANNTYIIVKSVIKLFRKPQNVLFVRMDILYNPLMDFGQKHTKLKIIQKRIFFLGLINLSILNYFLVVKQNEFNYRLGVLIFALQNVWMDMNYSKMSAFNFATKIAKYVKKYIINQLIFYLFIVFFELLQICSQNIIQQKMFNLSIFM
ncbi:unnamed protein product [Paramecium sonneborni]|uniref:Transmembrane protein n=1 Tax=Paramecium sonneborni TaxID=65129 RepID=A0A8S1NFK5_9CILI|nr:unnamed protein product [Paramecium sonneborni]